MLRQNDTEWFDTRVRLRQKSHCPARPVGKRRRDGPSHEDAGFAAAQSRQRHQRPKARDESIGFIVD
jgi:hypothetical protein